jgi:O-antigen/teichoic acid export membrane protein
VNDCQTGSQGTLAPPPASPGDPAGLLSRARKLVGFGSAQQAGAPAPLLRNAYALMTNTVVTGLLGLAFWLLAARHYAAADVGRASAAYSAMNLLAGVTALSLIGAMARFIPRSGRRAGLLIRRGYSVSAASAVVGAVIFLVLMVGRPGSSYAELAGLRAGAIFTGCVVVWSLFTLQDGALIGLRGARWVAVENAAFGVAKIALLLPLAIIIPHTGLYVSWMVPAVIAVPAVNLLIFGRLLPRHPDPPGNSRPPDRRQVGRFLAGDVTGALCLLATVNLVPVLVAAFIGPGANAYFYMAWTIGIIIDMLAANMALSLTVEGSFDPARLAGHFKAALRRTLLLLVPIAVGTALLAPRILGMFGPGYAHYGGPILELLAVATLPRTVTELYLGALRAQSRTSLVALVQGGRAVLILGLTLLLINLIGIVGAGVAVLASQVIMAIAVAPGLLRLMAQGKRRSGLAVAGEAAC